MKEANDALSNLSSQSIYETLLNNDEFESMNPFDIVQKISEFNQNEMEFNSQDILTNELFVNLDSFTEKLSVDAKKLDSLLDELLDSENEIDNIKFDSDHENIYELDKTPTIEILDSFLVENLSDEEINKNLKSDQKKIGSNLQRTIKVFDLYNSNSLLFKDEATELSDLIINKLSIFWEIIIDFSKVNNISDSFLRGTFEEISKFFTPNELIKKIDIINIDDELSIKIFKDIIPNAFKYWSNNSNQNIDFEKIELLKQLGIPESERGYLFINAVLCEVPGISTNANELFNDGDHVGIFPVDRLYPYQYRDGLPMSEGLKKTLEERGAIHHSYL